MKDVVIFLLDSSVFMTGFFWGLFFGFFGVIIFNIIRKVFGREPVTLHLPTRDEKSLQKLETLEQQIKELDSKMQSFAQSPIPQSLVETSTQSLTLLQDMQATLNNPADNTFLEQSFKDLNDKIARLLTSTELIKSDIDKRLKSLEYNPADELPTRQL